MSTDNLLFLPVDILVLIFRNLRKSDLRNVMLTCKTLRDFIKSENRIWRSLALAQGSLIFQESADNRWFNVLSWYNRCRISNNWQKGCYKTKVLVHYYTNYMPWIVFDKSEVLLSSVGSELVCYRTDNKGIPNCNKTLWKLEVPKVMRHDVRTNDISRFVMRDARIVCGNRDGCVAVYKVNNMMKKPKLEVHIKDCHDLGDAEVSAVELVSSRDMLTVLSGSNDVPEIFLYNMRSGNQIIPNPHGNQHMKRFAVENILGIKALSLNTITNQLAIGPNGNNLPAVFDVRTGQFVVSADAAPNHRQAVRDIQWRDENTIVYVTHSGFLQMLDTRSRELVFKTRDPFQSTLYCGKTDGGNCIMVGSAEYSRCVLFDARKPTHHVQMYFTQRNTSPVYCLEFDSSKLISAVDRGVALLNFNIDGSSQEQRDYSNHIFH